MNRLMLLGAAVAALGLTACERTVSRTETETETDGGALRTIAKLDCPDKQGALTLASKAADGKSCAYAAEGAEVTLRLVALTNGDAKAALDPIEAELKGIIPPPAEKPKTDAIASNDADTAKSTDQVEINFPGVHIKADDGGAKVRVGNVRVDADDDGANVKVGDETTVNANDGGAEVRTAKSSDQAIRATYILASDKGANEHRLVGYEARGPKAGPIVVAVVKAKGDDHARRDLFDDMKDLVERNVGE